MIVNPANAVTALTLDEVQAIFLGTQTYWPGQKEITPITRPEAHNAGKQFFRRIMKMTPSRFTQHWTGLELSGRGVTPSRK